MGPANPLNDVNSMPEWRPAGAVAGVERLGHTGDAEAKDTVPGGFVIQEQKPLPEGLPQFLETIALGSKAEGQFTPVVRFGLADDRRGQGRGQERAHVTAWVSDGYINRFAPYVRPNTPYDFKLRLDLDNKRMSAWVSGRGDDDWFLLAEDVALHSQAQKINWLQVELYPDAPAIEGLMVRDKPYALAERVRPHPSAKTDRVVGAGRGFTFQAMRSTWRKPGKHVTIFRQPGVHAGFPDVAQAGPRHLVCVWRNGSHTGGGYGGISIAHSYDLGQTWSEPEVLRSRGHVPRIKRLADGTLLLLDDFKSGGSQFTATWDVVMWESRDEGQTWTNERWLRTKAVGGGGALRGQ